MRRHQPQTFVHAITFKQLSGFLSFWWNWWPWSVDYLIKFKLIFILTLTLNFQGQIWNLLYLDWKWSDCHEMKSKHIDWNPGLKCNHRIKMGCNDLPDSDRHDFKCQDLFNIKTLSTGMGISIIKTRQMWDRLIFRMGIPILLRLHLYIETTPSDLNNITKLSETNFKPKNHNIPSCKWCGYAMWRGRS